MPFVLCGSKRPGPETFLHSFKQVDSTHTGYLVGKSLNSTLSQRMANLPDCEDLFLALLPRQAARMMLGIEWQEHAHPLLGFLGGHEI